MTPLPPALGGGDGGGDGGPLVAWRLDAARHAATWDSGEGAYQVSGRWHAAGFRMLYASLDPATCLLEAAVHKGFDALDRVPHVLTSFELPDPGRVLVVRPEDLPNPRWLQSAQASAGQRRWGQERMSEHDLVVVPSTVSQRSWNLIFAIGPTRRHRMRSQEALSLDTRLNAG